MTSQIVELDSVTKALQICGPNGAEVRMGAMADGYVFMQYDGWSNRIFPSNSPDISLGKYPVQPGKIPVVRAIRHNHRRASYGDGCVRDRGQLE